MNSNSRGVFAGDDDRRFSIIENTSLRFLGSPTAGSGIWVPSLLICSGVSSTAGDGGCKLLGCSNDAGNGAESLVIGDELKVSGPEVSRVLSKMKAMRDFSCMSARSSI